MTLWSRLGRAITTRIEASPRIQEQEARNQRLLPFVTAAEQIAATTLPDEQARERLIERSSLREHLDEAAVWDAVEWLGRGRTAYIQDRAYRLLTAAIADTPVRPIDPDVVELFEREAQLGRQPLQQAYDHLAALQPELGGLPEHLNQTLTRTTDSKTRHREISKATQGSSESAQWTSIHW